MINSDDDEDTPSTAMVSKEATPKKRKVTRDAETAHKGGGLSRAKGSVPVEVNNDDDDDDDFEEGSVRKRKEGVKKAGGKSRRGSSENHHHEKLQDDGQDSEQGGAKKNAKGTRRRSTPENESAQNGDVSDTQVSDPARSPKMFTYRVPVQKGGCNALRSGRFGAHHASFMPISDI